jgi:hypothetical protein
MVGFLIFSSTFSSLRVLLVAATFLVSATAYSTNTCQAQKSFPSSDMRKDFGPIRDQGSIGWCYAYGAADQAGHWLKKNRGIDTTLPGKAISASAVALETNGEDRSKSLGQSDAIRRVQAATAQLTQEARDKENRQREVLGAKLSVFVGRDKRASELLDRVADRQAKLMHQFAEEAKKNPSPLNGVGTGGGGMMMKPSATDMFDPTFPPDWEIKKNKTEFEKLVLKDPAIDTEYKKLLYHQSEVQALVSIYPKNLEEDEGGNSSEVLAGIMENGYCTEDEVPSEGFDYKPKISPMNNGIVMPPSTSDGVKAILNEGIGKYTASPTAENLCEATDAAKSIFPKLSQKEISNVLEAARKNENDAVDQLLKTACTKKKIDLPRPKVVAQTLIPDQDGGVDMAWVRELLKKGTPVGIAYHSEVFSESPDVYKYSSKRGSHYSLLVGQRYNCDKGEPEYILRNSWGQSGCETSSAAYLNRNGAKAPYTCEDGYYIIPESQLKMGLFRTVHFE